MSVHDELTSVERCLDDLLRAVGRLEKQADPGSLELRRVRSDANHLRESLALLRETTPAPPRRPDLLPISDAPYDSTLWTDSDDEGVGNRHRP
ncbi:MAG TPA: hypothetical protein VIU15_11175 [Streptomyces sp.]